VDIIAEALPGRTFSGVVTFVQPIVTEETRTVRVPVHVENKDHALKPGMFVSATVRATLSASGDAAPTGLEGKYTCPMHPQVLRDEPGKCPICEMPLEVIPGTPAKGQEQAVGHDHATSRATPEGDASMPLAIPASAVLDSGTRRIAYVEVSPGLFEARDVTVGPRSGEFVAVLKGLSDGERVVTRGGFLIDSQFQITGRPSLFYPGGLAAGAGAGHQHGGGSTGGGTGGAKPADAAPVHKH
jgi:Cu(I)/Ag(I) efflux system membrane fusion protein